VFSGGKHLSAKLIDLLVEDYKSRRTRAEVLGVEVFVTPLTLGEQTQIAAMHPDDSALRVAEMLVRKCRNADGHAVFAKEDKQTLKREVAGDALGPLIAAITGPGAAELAKNSEAIDEPSSATS
jgi:hypothetical protein